MLLLGGPVSPLVCRSPCTLGCPSEQGLTAARWRGDKVVDVSQKGEGNSSRVF